TIEAHMRPGRDETGRRLGDDPRRRKTHDMHVMREGAAGPRLREDVRRRQVSGKYCRRSATVEYFAADLLAGKRRPDDTGQALAVARDLALPGRAQGGNGKGPDLRTRTSGSRLRARRECAEDGF